MELQCMVGAALKTGSSVLFLFLPLFSVFSLAKAAREGYSPKTLNPPAISSAPAALPKTAPSFQNTRTLRTLTQSRGAASLKTASFAPGSQPIHPSFWSRYTLLSGGGALKAGISEDQITAWKAELGQTPPWERLAQLHIWLGEYEFDHNEKPDIALWHFQQAAHLCSTSHPLYGLALYDIAITHYYQGAYQDAALEFRHLLAVRPAGIGYDFRNCALFAQHAAACWGYHQAHSQMGVPEPDQADPQCGAAALAACLRSLSMPSDRKTVLRYCRVTGMGSSWKDIETAGKRMGLQVRGVSADDAGLIALPKPLIALVEHDHFIAVTGASRAGVTYLCSDCGPWPGGKVFLPWKAYHALNASAYGVVVRKGSWQDQRLQSLLSGKRPIIRVASAGPLRALIHMLPAMRVMQASLIGSCGPGPRPSSPQPPCFLCMILDFLGFSGGLGGGDGGGIGGEGGLGWGGPEMAHGSGGGDPVDLSTLEEEYHPPTDLTVYNPVGPSVTWQRIYDSLGTGNSDFGDQWSHPYNMWVTQTSNPYMPATGTKALTLENGATINFTANAVPSATQPKVVCPTQVGAPMTMEWDFDGTTWGKLVVTNQDRTQWIFAGANSNTQPLSQIKDRNGNAITFNYVNSKLASINNSAGTNLLTLTRDNNGYLSSVSDCYNRSVYYTVGTYPGSWYELNQVSQIVPTGTVNPPLRYTYGYTTVGGSFPFLGTITVPSPTGTGNSTSTINYNTTSGYVTSLQDANGNTRTYSTVDNTHRQVTVADSGGHTAFSYIGRYDNNMSATGVTDGSGNLTSSEVYADSNDPYRPSSVSDGNGSALNPEVQQGHTTTFLSTGSDQPAPRQWDIQYNNGLVAYPSNTNGWTVSVSGTSGYPGYPGGGPMTYTFTVTAPAAATIQNYYSVHYTTGGNPAYVSASFDVVAPGGSTNTGNPVVPQGGSVTFNANGNTAPSSPNWDIIRGGTMVTTSDTPNGWSVSAPGLNSSNSSANITVTAPAGAAVGSGYEVRYTTLINNYYPANISGIFDVVGPGTLRKGTASLTWDQWGNCTSMTDPRGITTTYTYDYTNFAMGELVQVQTGMKSPTTFTYYEPSGLLHTVTTPVPGSTGGSQTVTTSFSYDALGNVLNITRPGNATTTTIATNLNYTTDTMLPGDPNYVQGGTYTQVAAIGQPVTVTDNVGKVTQVRYDNRGNKKAGFDAMGYETDQSFNIADQPLTTTYPATGQSGIGHATATNTYLYADGPLLTINQANESGLSQRSVTITYGKEGEMLSRSGSAEPVTYGYDAAYRRASLKDGNNNTTTYSYNTSGYLASAQYPGGDTSHFTSYDGNGQLLQRIDGNGVTTNYNYNDPESQLTDIQYPATTSLNVHLTYDNYGRRATMSDSTGSQSYGYDDLNLPLAVQTNYTGLPAQTISYSYNPDGTRLGMTTPAGNFSYGYDGDGRPNSLTNPYTETSSWTYLDNGWLSTQALGNGALATYSYNPRHLLTRLLNTIPVQGGGSATLSDFGGTGGMVYDGYGNRTSTPVIATNYGGTSSYTYDTKDELTQESTNRGAGGTNNFGYDAAFNPTSFKGQTNTFNSNSQFTNTGFAYDSNGNPTNYNGTATSFDPENRMTQYGATLTAGYTGDNLRAWKQNANGRTYFLYDGDHPIIELSGGVTTVNTFGPTGLLSRHTAAGSVFYSFDAQGSVAHRTDSSWNVISNSLFDAFGNKLSAGAQSDPWGFVAQAGYFTDSETGLILCTNRYYDPALGRWLNRDPIGYVGGVNLYGYVGNGPLGRVDPSGHFWLPVILIIIAVAAILEGCASTTNSNGGPPLSSGDPTQWAPKNQPGTERTSPPDMKGIGGYDHAATPSNPNPNPTNAGQMDDGGGATK